MSGYYYVFVLLTYSISYHTYLIQIQMKVQKYAVSSYLMLKSLMIREFLVTKSHIF